MHEDSSTLARYTFGARPVGATDQREGSTGTEIGEKSPTVESLAFVVRNAVVDHRSRTPMALMSFEG
jgi:hypothetical protein